MIAEEIFLKAIEKKTPVERAAFLDGACGNNAELRAEVEALIASDAEAGDFLEQPLFNGAGDTIAHVPIGESTGSMIGPYKLLEKIGEGGFGVVFMAEQQKPVVRKVALKIVKPGMDTREVVARFEAERQALAIMDHPNIARVLDGGETESGRPYFVMELVRGIPITEYCDQRNLTPDERLYLFISVCHAVQHAHQKGVIHRDIKPSNVLVTLHDGQPVVKVIDFGVAKAISQRLTEKTLFTRFSQMVGTPLYMSPEQAELSGLEVDTRTDIYALGVLLYELLTGTTPFDRDRLREAAYDEIRRIIREEEPPKPSTRISTLGAALTAVCSHRQTEPQRLSKMVKGDLDWIVMKALEKDRDRRYATATGFAADVERYLTHEPVTACPPSLGYRAKKYWQRNSRLVVTAASLFMLLIAGLIGTTSGWLSSWEKRKALISQRDEIEWKKGHIEAIQRNLTTQLLVSIRRAQPTEFAMSVANVKPIAEQVIPNLKTACDDTALPLTARINCALALAELGESTDVVDFLLEQLDAVPPPLSGEFIRTMQQATGVADQLAAMAARAEQDKNLERWARLAIVGLYLGNPEVARDMLKFRADNVLRLRFLATFAGWHGPIADLASIARREQDLALRTGMAQAAGLASAEESDAEPRQAWLPLLAEWYTSAKDATTRSSAEWLLRRWNVDLPSPENSDGEDARGWTQGPGDLFMVYVPTGEFTMGTLGVSLSAQRVRITRPFLISDRQVGIRLFQQFTKEMELTDDLDIATTDSTQAMHNANWHAIRAFLNWLSKREGLEPCYIEQRSAVGSVEYALRRDANGYRLPTEAEWEYACRAGTITECSFGGKARGLFNNVPSFERVAWMPNTWGLFDMYSVAGEVVEDKYSPLPLSWGITESVIDPLRVVEQPGRADVIVRGAESGSSSRRRRLPASAGRWPVAFRIARNAPNTLSASVECVPAVDRTQASLARLATVTASGCAPHFSEIAREQMSVGQLGEAARKIDSLLPYIPPEEDAFSARSQFLTRLAHHADVYSRLVELRPNDTHLRVCRARYWALQEKWTEAAAEFELAVGRRDPQNSTWQNEALDRETVEYAILLMYASRESDYEAYIKRLMTEAEKYRDDIGPMWAVLKAATVAPLRDADSRQLLQRWWTHISAKRWDKAGLPPAGLAAYRTGQYTRVFELLGKWEPWDGPRYGPILAMAHWRHGNTKVAWDLLGRQQRRELPSIHDGWPGYFEVFDECLTHNLLLTEAERAIYGPEESRLADVAKQLAEDKGGDAPEYWQAQSELARAIERQSFQRDRARELYDVIYDNQVRILGMDHPDTKATAKRLADVIYNAQWAVLWARHTEDEYCEAFRLLQRAHQVVPNDAKYAVPVAWGYYRTGKPSEAAKVLDAVADKADVFACDTWFLRAIMAKERGDKEEASQWFVAGSYLAASMAVGTQRLAMDSLGRYDSQPPTDDRLLEALEFLIHHCGNDHNLYVQRGLANVRVGRLTEAHASFKKAFDLCPSLEVADWLAMTSRLTDQSADGAMATAILLELIHDDSGLEVAELLRRAQAYCIHPGNQDYSGILEAIDAVAEDDQDPNVVLTRSMVQYRLGQETQIVPMGNDEDPQSSVLSMCFAALAQCRAGQHEAARRQLAEIQDYLTALLASPEGPDFPGAQRAHAWTVSQILLKEVTQAISTPAPTTAEDRKPAE